MKLIRTKLAVAIVLSLGALSAHATVFSNVDFNYDGVAGKDIIGVSTFDWQPTSNLVIEDALVSSSTGATSLAAFFAGGGVVGSTVQFKFHAQSRLNDMVGGLPPAQGVGLDPNGPAVGGTWEVTQVLDAIETAMVTSPGVITFTGITGKFAFYLDSLATGGGAPDTVNSTGAGFTNGIKFMEGDVVGTGGTFNGLTGDGDSNLQQVITGYNSSIIEANPISGAPLIGATFDSHIQLEFGAGGAEKITVGSPIGAPLYLVKGEDLILNQDSQTTFSVPEPSSLLLLGSSLIGLVGFKRRKI